MSVLRGSTVGSWSRGADEEAAEGPEVIFLAFGGLECNQGSGVDIVWGDM